MPSVISPIINGNRYSFSSIAFELFGEGFDIQIIGVKSINYSDALKPGIIRGTGPGKAGRTTGIEDPELSFTLYRREWDVLRRYLAGADGVFGTKLFQVTVTYQEGVDLAGNAINADLLGAQPTGDPGHFEQQVVLDVMEDCRITKATPSNEEGADASVVDIECDVMRIAWGKGPGEGGAYIRRTPNPSASADSEGSSSQGAIGPEGDNSVSYPQGET